MSGGSPPPPSPVTAPSHGPLVFFSSRRGRWTVLGAIGVGIILIGGLLLAGAPSSLWTSVPGRSFSPVESQSTSVLPAGSWELSSAAGIAAWNTTTLSLDLTSISGNCAMDFSGGSPPTQITLPAFRGNLTTGVAPIWLFEYVDPSAGMSAAVIDEGSPTLLFTAAGANCPLVPTNVTAIPPTIVDSSVAAQALAVAGAANYLAANPSGISLIMSLAAGLPLTLGGTSPQWFFSYSPCTDLLGGNISGPANATAFSGIVNATTGAVEQAQPVPNSCQNIPPSPPLASVFGLGPPGLVTGAGTNVSLAIQGCQSKDYCYQIPVAYASGGVSPAEMSLEVTFSNGTPEAGVVGYAITNGTGPVLLYSYGANETAWSVGAGTPTQPYVTGDVIWVDMGPSSPASLGLLLVVTGLGPYSGNIVYAALP